MVDITEFVSMAYAVPRVTKVVTEVITQHTYIARLVKKFAPGTKIFGKKISPRNKIFEELTVPPCVGGGLQKGVAVRAND